MPTGFIYVVNTVTREYAQPSFSNVPTEWDGRLYFGPCKRPMRPRMKADDFIFGLSPAHTPSRRFVFVASIDECITFADAYHRFPALRGPGGPIHVRPISGRGSFPASDYQHIPGSSHPEEWKADIKTFDLDRFFVCEQGAGWRGRWLGPHGPEIDREILAFLKTCSVHGAPGRLGRNTGTRSNPIAWGRLFTGLHLETEQPEQLLKLCAARMRVDDLEGLLESVETPQPETRNSGTCRGKRSGCSAERTGTQLQRASRR